MLEVRGRTRVLFLLQDLQKLYIDRWLWLGISDCYSTTSSDDSRFIENVVSYILQDPGWLNYPSHQGWSPWEQCGVPNGGLQDDDSASESCIKIVMFGLNMLKILVFKALVLPYLSILQPYPGAVHQTFIPNLPGHHSSGVAWWTFLCEPRKIWVQKAGRVLVPRKRTIYWHHGPWMLRATLMFFSH